VVAADQGKVAAIAEAQRDGRFGDRFPAAELIVLVTGLSALGAPDFAMPRSGDIAQRVEAVRMLTEGESS
jgi:hypothetical protein